MLFTTISRLHCVGDLLAAVFPNMANRFRRRGPRLSEAADGLTIPNSPRLVRSIENEPARAAPISQDVPSLAGGVIEVGVGHESDSP